MTYSQITAAERYALMALRVHGASLAETARVLGRHRSTMARELARNATNHDGSYRPALADSYARTRRSPSRRNTQFGADAWRLVERVLCEDWSPEQVAGWCARHRRLSISIEMIYRHIWADQAAGGTLYTHLRCATKHLRTRYGRPDSRGRLRGNARSRRGHAAPPSARSSGTGKATPCWATARAARPS
jgi:transposase, IS30 family